MRRNNNKNRTMSHTVQAKETFYSIAKKYSLTVEQLVKINNLTNNNLFIGQVLKIDLPIPTNNNSKPIPTQALTVFDQRKDFQIKKEVKSNYNYYILSFPSPTGLKSTGVIRDNYPSSNLGNPQGVSYTGLSFFETNRPIFNDLCQQEFYLDLLRFIAKERELSKMLNFKMIFLC